MQISDYKLPAPAINYCFAIYQNLTNNEIIQYNIKRYNIKYSERSYTQTVMVGNVVREMFIFTSHSYPLYLFLISMDKYPDGVSRSSLFYRVLPSTTLMNPLNSYTMPNIKYVTNPQEIFNNGIIACTDLYNTPSNNINYNLLNNNNTALSKLNKELLKPQIQDVGEDPKLQETITEFYTNKIIKWMEKAPEYNKVKKHLRFIKTSKGTKYVYKILKNYTVNKNKKWYELRSESIYDNIKDHILKKLLLL
jgi:hypothetical protein